MTDLLVKKFVKDYEQVHQNAVRTRYGILSSSVGIFCNAALFMIKLLIGLAMHSIAVTADAFNNLSDAAASVISFLGVKMASRPADEGHPFGHGRMEYIAAFIVAFLVIQVGFSFARSSFGKILHPESISFEWIPFVILVLSVTVKIWMALFNRKLGKRIDSKVMLAAAADSMGDVATTSVTIAAILVYRISGWNIDAYAGIIVSLLVMWAGIGIVRETLGPLIGEPIDPKLCQELTGFIESFDGIEGTHDLVVHNYGPGQRMASIHAEVPREIDIDRSHEIIDLIEQRVSEEKGIYMVIHMDPVEIHDPWVLKIKQQVGDMISQTDPALAFHDFRIVRGHDQINMFFDLVMPLGYDKKMQETAKTQISEMIYEQKLCSRCVITVDRSFVGKTL